MARTAAQIADMIDRLQQYYAAISTLLIMLNDDDMLRFLHSKGYDEGSKIKLGRRDDSYYRTSICGTQFGLSKAVLDSISISWEAN